MPIKAKKQMDVSDQRSLQAAFKTFSAASFHLSKSYQNLESKVAELSKQLEESQKQRFNELQAKEMLANRLAAIVAALPGGVIVINKSGVILEYNKTAERLLDVSLAEKSWGIIATTVLVHGQLSAGDVILKNKRCVNLSFCPLGNCGEQIILISDVTQSRLINESASRYERLAAIGEMIAKFSHQIRTPLASCVLYLSGLEMRMDPDNKAMFYITKIRTCLDAIERNINDLLVYTKGKASVIEKIHLGDFLARVESCVQSILQTSCSKLVYKFIPDNVEISGNISALEGVLQNLVVNAIQAKSVGAEVNLEIIKWHDDIEIYVSDNGPGIAENIQSRIFEAFFTTKSDGTGLGLAFAKSVIEAHRGTLELLRSGSTGTVFRICLPQQADQILLKSRQHMSDQ